MKLSIIIPTYNEEEYLHKLLESIKTQSFTDYEIIIADADSVDGTREIAAHYGCKIVEGGLPGVGRNNGANIAAGEYLLFLDADAILTNDYLEDAINEFDDKDLDIAITQIEPLSDSKTDKIFHDLANLFMKSVESLKPHGAGCYGILTKKSMHEEADGFDESLDFGEDSNYIYKIGKIGNFRVLRKPKLLVSTRRLEKEGIKDLGRKYTKSTLYDFLGKKITAEQLDYTFGHSENEDKRIIYSVCGEGMGHAIRSSVIIEHLLKNNHKVIIFASDRAYDYLSKKFENVYRIHGFNTVYKENAAKYMDTFLIGMRNLPRDLIENFKMLYNIAKAFKPNIIISDFEAYASLISKIMRIPLISLDNIHIITQCEIDVPEEYRIEKIAANGVIRSFIVKPKEYLITTYFYPPVKQKNVSLFPPVLRDEILNLKPYNGEDVLVYQTSDSNHEIIEYLKKIDQSFVIYGFGIEKEEENLQFKEFSEEGFFKDLESAKAVIANGGFTLLSEAIYLGKPVLSVPVKKQFEQIVNALYLEKLGYGEFHEELDEEIIERFLINLDTYRESIGSFKYEGNQKVSEALDKHIKKYSKKYKVAPDSDEYPSINELLIDQYR